MYDNRLHHTIVKLINKGWMICSTNAGAVEMSREQTYNPSRRGWSPFPIMVHWDGRITLTHPLLEKKHGLCAANKMYYEDRHVPT